MSGKRLRESESFLLSEENVTKTPRTSKIDPNNRISVLQVIDKRFEEYFEKMKLYMKERANEQFEQMKAFIAEREDILLNKINNITVDLKKEVSCVNERVDTVANEILEIKAQLQELKHQTLRQENLFVACDLRINGIPYNENENLYNIFDSLCQVINISTPSVKSIYRLKNKNNKNKENSLDAVIIVNLMSPYDKNFVLKSLAIFKKNNKSQLLLNYIGENSNKPFYVNENLTANNYKILIEAIKLRNQNCLKSAYTFRGLVYVKQTGSDQPIRIDYIEQLSNFFLRSERSNSFQSTSAARC